MDKVVHARLQVRREDTHLGARAVSKSLSVSWEVCARREADSSWLSLSCCFPSPDLCDTALQGSDQTVKSA